MLSGVLLANLSLNLPLILSGPLLIGVSLFVILVFPETGFTPAPDRHRQSWRSAWETFSTGLGAGRRSSLLRVALLISRPARVSSAWFARRWTLTRWAVYP